MKRPMQVPGSIKVLANLNRRLQFGREPRETVKVVVNDRLLDPVEAQVIDQVTAVQCFSEIETLVKIDHQVTPIAGRGADCVDGVKIIPCILPPEPKFEPGETALISQFGRLSGDQLRVLEPKPITVVCLDRPNCAP